MLPPFELSPMVSKIGLWDYCFEHGTATANKNLYDIYGYGDDQPEWSVELLLHHVIPEDRERIGQRIAEILTSGSDFFAEYRIARVDGTVRLLRSLGTVLEQDGKPHLLRGMSFDITDFKVFLQTIADERDQWAFVSKTLGLGLWTQTAGTDSTRNEAHADIFGHDIRQKPTKSVKEFFGHVVPEDRARVRSIYEEALEQHADHRFDCRIRRQDGGIRWISVTGKVVRQEGRAPVMYCVTQDITAVKEKDAEIEELEARLIQSQKMEMVGQLAGGIAHDINNVLMAIQGNTELAQGSLEPTSPARNYLAAVITMVSRSAAMVSQLLSFARKNPTLPIALDVDAELEQTHLLLGKLIRENILLELRLDAGQARVNLDPSHLTQIITNLVVNARDAIAESGTIRIKTGIIDAGEPACPRCPDRDIDKPHLSIVVSDTGSGIAPQVLPHIFEPFFTTKGIGGSGLGLSTVYGLVKQNKGEIFCQSEVGKGTRFEIHFPVTSRCGTNQPDDPAAPSAPSCRKERIMVIEDEHEIGTIINMILEQQGYRVILADTAETAFELLEKSGESVDLIITDIMLPGMNGVQLRKAVLAHHPETKFLFMSGYSADAIGHYGVFDEASNFIPKPFTIGNFTRKVEALLVREA
jgi:PAS domain S-box-containing protein